LLVVMSLTDWLLVEFSFECPLLSPLLLVYHFGGLFSLVAPL